MVRGERICFGVLAFVLTIAGLSDARAEERDLAKEHGVSFAFPTRTLHVVGPSAESSEGNGRDDALKTALAGQPASAIKSGPRS